jgi:gamma-glutamyltranspeptidase
MNAIERHRASRAPVYGGHAMVVAGHSLAALAGVRTLERGGNIVDAMVATSAATASVLGHAAGLGGDCFLLYRDGKSGRTQGLNASGTAPELASPHHFPEGMKSRGAMASVVPGLVRAWDTMHRRFGKLPWEALFDAAIDLADSHPVAQVLATRIPAHEENLRKDPGCATLYFPHGRAIAPGDTLRQPALANTLRVIAREGADAFYEGHIAQAIERYELAHGGLLRASDLALYRPIWTEPIAVDYRGHRIETMPPNSPGVLLLMQLEGISAVDGATLIADPVHRLAYEMSAMKAAFAEGVRFIADPAAVPDAAARLLSPEMRARIQQRVLATGGAKPGGDSGGTSCILLADRQGNAISAIQSIFNVFGAAFLEPETGILLNNRLQSFTVMPGPNTLAPGKRPAHTLTPVMVLKDGHLRYTLATPGGLSQTLTLTQVISRLLDERMDVQTAVEAPRWCNTKSGDFLIEREFPEAIVPALASLGHNAERRDDGYFYGSAKAIELLSSGNLAGGADFRREGFAAGI